MFPSERQSSLTPPWITSHDISFFWHLAHGMPSVQRFLDFAQFLHAWVVLVPSEARCCLTSTARSPCTRLCLSKASLCCVNHCYLISILRGIQTFAKRLRCIVCIAGTCLRYGDEDDDSDGLYGEIVGYIPNRRMAPVLTCSS